MPKTILISQFPLPYSHIGSWTTMYRNYLEQQHQLDIIICEKPDFYFDNVIYEIVEDSFLSRFLRKIAKKRHDQYIATLKKVIKPGERYIIQVVDNLGLAKALHQFLRKNGLQKQCYIQYFYHGFAPIAGNQSFYDNTDEIITLTKSSYHAFRSQTNSMPPRFSVLHNGIDTNKFFPVSTSEKEELKQKLGIQNKKIFIWCSQDRPKKGLHLILDVWKRISKSHDNVALVVVGCEPKAAQKNVFFLGKVPNDALPGYFQAADVYLFPTLCQEGFGMSVIEALHCGCYCIASAIGGVPEVLQYGKLGTLIENPHFISEWITAIEIYLSETIVSTKIPRDLYTTTSWNNCMNSIITQAKLNFQ